jgi:flagellum-specific peptidoglycan hydrolase FlgJ
MIISLTRDNREKLSKSQQEFFLKLVPISRKVQEWTYHKSSFLNVPCPKGILASVTIADVLYKSSWGSHPISQAEYLNKYSNNINLIEAGEHWKGKVHTYEERKYRAYKDWRDWGIDQSDYYVFSRAYDLALFSSTESTQIRAISVTNRDYSSYYNKVLDLIKEYNLSEFNI